MGLVTSQPAAGEGRNPLFPVRERETQRHRIEILDNPIAAEQPALARSLEAELRRLLKDADVGTVEVRFRVCRDGTAGEAVRFICKVENPPCDGEDGRVQWRWWSPLMETVQDFRTALEEGLQVRRDRLASRARGRTV